MPGLFSSHVLRNALALVPLLGVACGGQSITVVVADDAGTQASSVGADAAGPLALDCEPDAAAVMKPVDLSVKDTLRGENGVFADSCDSHGDLVDYVCETQVVCGQGLDQPCVSYNTGKVVPQNIDCSGHCLDGTCDGRCPTFNQRVTYAAVGAEGAATIHNDTDGRTYSCTLSSSQDPSVTYDCLGGPRPGLQGTIESLGLHGSPCTGDAFGGIGIKVDGFSPQNNQWCGYDCRIP